MRHDQADKPDAAGHRRRGARRQRRSGRGQPQGAGNRNAQARSGVLSKAERIEARPQPRYAQPIMMNQAHYNWVASSEHQGVHEKLLGVFTERRSEAGLFMLSPGATLSGTGRGLYLAYRGAGRVDGQPLRPLTTVFLERGERASFVAEQETELLHFGLPDLRGLETRPAYAAEAAE